MSDPKPFASLSPSLLARKGGAKPAMRPQIQPLHQFQENAARQIEEDLGWNDMGEPYPEPEVDVGNDAGEVVPFNGQDAIEIAAPFVKPEVVRQQEAIVHSIVRAEAPKRAVLRSERRAAFTLRLDGDRHLKLRLASTVSNRSAQQLVTEALDRLLDEMPDVASLASHVRKQS